MPQPHWSAPLLARLAEQPPDVLTLTLTLDDVATIVGAPLPPGTSSRGYWHVRSPNVMGYRLRAAGWWVSRLKQRGDVTTLTFTRYELIPCAAHAK